jgi:hypothetical protein
MSHNVEQVEVGITQVPDLIKIVDQNTLKGADMIELNIAGQKLPVITSYAFYEYLTQKTSLGNGTERGTALRINSAVTNKGAPVLTGETDFRARDMEPYKLLAKELSEQSKEGMVEMQKAFEKVFEEYLLKDKFSADDLGSRLSREAANRLLNGLLNPKEVEQIQEYIKLNLAKTTVPAIVGALIPVESVQVPFTKLVNDALLRLSGEYETYHNTQDGAIDLVKLKISDLIGKIQEGDKKSKETIIGKLVEMSLERTGGNLDETIEMAKDHTMSILQALLDTTTGSFSGHLDDYARLGKGGNLNSLEKATNPKEFLKDNVELFEDILKVYCKYGQVTFDPRVVKDDVVLPNGYLLKAGSQVGLSTAAIGISFGYKILKEKLGDKIPAENELTRKELFDLLDETSLFDEGEELNMKYLRNHPIFLKILEGESMKGSCIGADFTLSGHMMTAVAYNNVVTRTGKRLKVVEEKPIEAKPFRKNESVMRFV